MPKAIKRYNNLEKRRLYRNIQRKRNYNKTAYAKNHRKPFTDYEDTLILDHAITDIELSNLIGRSVQSIQFRRCRLKKINMEDKNNGN